MDYSFLGSNSYSYIGGIGPSPVAYTGEPELSNPVEDSHVGDSSEEIKPRN